jgi:hypothetical protein
VSNGAKGTLPEAVATLAGAKHVATLQRHLAQLRDAYDHGNRRLFYDELVTAYLLAFFNPTLRSLRAIEDAGTLVDAEGHPTHLRKLCRSTMSDAAALFDARLLVPLARQLRARIPDLKRRDGQLAQLLDHVQLVDGSFFNSAADVAWALRDRAGCSKARLDLRLNGSTLLPVRLSVGGKGQSEASRAAGEQVEPGVIYVTDRGFEHFGYVHAVLDGNADLVLRVKTTLNFTPRTQQSLDADDAAAGVLSDRIGRLTGSPHAKPPKQELREIVVFDLRHPDKPLRLVTSLLDLPARVIAQLYRHRWQIELFFRWLKVHAHFAHLVSRSKNGMTLGFHVAVIATLLIYLHSGRPMSKYAYNLLSLVAAGWGTVDAALAVLARREAACARDRTTAAARAARKRAAKTSV